MALDVKLFYLLNSLADKSRVLDALTVFTASYLQYFLIAAFFLLLYFSGRSIRHKLYIFGVTAVSVITARLGITEIIRFFYHRPRPFFVYQFQPLISENDWSFPSGHSAFFFAMAAAIYLHNKKWGIWFFIAAFIMNISRIVAGVHYPSDIFGGMIVGIVTACLIFYFVEKRKTKEITGYENH